MPESDSVKLERAVHGLRKISETRKTPRQLNSEDARHFLKVAQDTLTELGLGDSY